MKTREFADRVIHDPIYKTRVKLYLNFALNLFYSVTKMWLGFRSGVIWDVVLALHYVILASMRLALIIHSEKHGFGEDERREYIYYIITGVMFLVLDLILSISVSKMVTMKSRPIYSDIRIYAMAVYAFAKVFFAVRGVAGSRKYGSPVMSAIKAISFVSAIMAMLSLETAMIDKFGGSGEELEVFRATMISVSGLGVSIIVLVTAVYMTVRGIRRYRG